MSRIRYRLVNSRSIFAVSLFVMTITVLAVWLLGLGSHQTLFVNSLWSVSLLSGFFLLFIVAGLYRGIKLRDDVGRITDRFRYRSWGDLSGLDLSDGCGDELGGIFAWIFAAIAAVLLILLLGNVLWWLILVFAAMLYWIFFRALRLVFRKSPVCRGHLLKSIGYGLWYTLLYNCWIYAVIMAAHRLLS